MQYQHCTVSVPFSQPPSTLAQSFKSFGLYALDIVPSTQVLLNICFRKSHMAGVCCIASSPRQEHCLLTGSYDEHIRMWDSRKFQCPVAEVSGTPAVA